MGGGEPAAAAVIIVCAMITGAGIRGLDATECDRREDESKQDLEKWLDGKSMVEWEISKNNEEGASTMALSKDENMARDVDPASINDGSLIGFYSDGWRGSTGISRSTIPARIEWWWQIR